MFINVDWAESITDQRSTFGYCTFVLGNLVTWRSKKQNVAARSAEVKCKAMGQGVCESLWLKKIIQELQLPMTPHEVVL